MRQHQISNLKEADIFFYCRGAVGFFDSYVPKLEPEDGPMIYRRNYFDIQENQIGYYVPILWRDTHLSVKHFENPRPWGKHPKLTMLEADLEEWLHRKTREKHYGKVSS